MDIRATVPAREKMPTGIAGFDDISHGGLLRGQVTLLLGSAGTGKTVFALQTLVNGASADEPGIFVAFEENSRDIIVNAAGFGWGISALEEQGKIYFLDARMSPDAIKSGAFDINGILVALDAKAKSMKAKRIVFDSIDVLLSLLDSAMLERQEMYRLHDWLQKSQLTGIVTARIESDVATARYGFMQFLADCVVVFYNRVAERVAVRELRIVKFRGSSFEQNEFPMTIGPTGIELSSFPTEESYPAFKEKISSGIDRLDAMLGGGYFRGSTILITGSPGTAKTTIGGAFIDAACKRGESALFVGFAESDNEMVRNLKSVNIDLEPHIKSGLLRIVVMRADARSAEEHLLALKSIMTEVDPRVMVIDPLSALMKAGGHLPALSVSQWLIHRAKELGITVLMTSLLETPEPATEASQIRVSTIADTWIHVTFVATGGERNRALSIIKSRGSAHSNQVRELVISHEGVTLRDVYSSRGEVLMGTLRLQKELDERQDKVRQRVEIEHKRHELELAQVELTARLKVLERELEARRAETILLDEQQSAIELRVKEEERRRIEKREGEQKSDTRESGDG